MGVADRIREVMKGAGMTVDRFAEALDEKPQRVKDVLREKQRAPEDLLVKIIQRFEIDANWLLMGAAREGVTLAPDEAALLDNYRNSPPTARDHIKATSAAFAQSKVKKKAG